MNPDKTIKPWLLACARQFGVKEAHPYRWPDASTRDQVPYFTYRPLRGTEVSPAYFDLTTSSDDNTVHRRSAQPHKQFFEINLYRHDDGMAILERCCLATKNTGALKKLFDEHGCSFAGKSDVENPTEWDDEKIYYHFQVIVVFNENIEITIDEVNGEVEQVDVSFEAGGTIFEIDRSGVTET